MKNNFYITTPIYYVNDVPHIGHTCTTVIADIIARYKRQIGDNVFFLTGTDEHGNNVAQAAEKSGLSPQEFCDKVSKRFQDAWKKLNISNDFFIRTTDPRHEAVVKQFLTKIFENNDIYKGKYEGSYCLGCEKFINEGDIVNGKCPLHPSRELSHECEENYFFKLSKYVPQIISLIENDRTNYIFPESKRKEILSKLKAGINDISVSREKVKWGVPVPWDKRHTAYVWFDALINYYSATQFLPGKTGFWPADVHVLAKDILWFHAVIWPAMLLSANLPLPQQVYAHGFYTIEGQKMSKSLGNVISPEQLVKKFGVDGARYLIASSFPAEDDADIGWEKLKEKYNADLANGLGNIIARVSSLVNKFCGGKVPPIDQDPDSHPLRVGKDTHNWKKAWSDIDNLLPRLKTGETLESIWKFIKDADKYISDNRPWELAQKDVKKFNWVIYGLLDSIHQIAWQINPFLPQTATTIAKSLNIKKLLVKNPQGKDSWTNIRSGTKIATLKNLFPRIV